MQDNKNLITLKEAARLSGYSADYIGQLIRAGKINGKQVYCNIAWMTTAKAVLDYKNNANKQEKRLGLQDKIKNKFRQILMEFNVIKLFFNTFKASLPILAIILISFLLLSFYLFYYFTKSATILPYQDITVEEEENITF